VGLRAPSLYTYFGSKNAMYDAMYAQAARDLAGTLARRPQASDPRQTLRGRMRLFTGFCVADPVRYQLLLERPIPGFEPAPESFQITVAALAATRADLEAAGVHGEPAQDMFRALITGLVSLQIANDPGGDRWTRLQDDALDMFLAHHATPAHRTAQHPPKGR
jgi:AcrR family transcriptional regulator